MSSTGDCVHCLGRRREGAREQGTAPQILRFPAPSFVTFPPFVAGESHYFLGINRSKKSLVIDLQQFLVESA
jgi:hypothetical protein